MTTPRPVGGIIHTYQKYDPVNIPGPSQPPPDLVSPAFEHWLEMGNLDNLTDEELARAVRIDPSMIGNLGPSIQHLRKLLEERRRKILETYETKAAQKSAMAAVKDQADKTTPPTRLKKDFDQALKDEQLRDLEELYYRLDGDRGFGRALVQLVARMGDKYEIDEMAGKYEFTGRTKMDVPKALEVKEELDTIEKLLKQLKEAEKSAQVGIIDLEELSQFVEQADVEALRALQQQVEDYIKEEARKQGLDRDEARQQYQMSPKAFRLFQSKVLTTIFNEMQASRTGRHSDYVEGEGATESPRTKQYEFGDSVAHMDVPGSFVNALLRQPGTPVRMKPDDILVHTTRNTPKAATCVLLDMSGSMRYDNQYVNVKRMGLALDGLIRSEYPGDFLQFIEMYTFAKPRPISEIPGLMPKPVTIYEPVVRLKADMSNPKLTEFDIPWHFTNIQHALQTARRYLATQDTPNRQIVLITDGLPTAHFDGSMLYLLYPPHPQTEEATMREARLCEREGITINIFLLSTWNQSEEDVRFARRMAEQTKGRVIYTTGRELERFVVWDYVKRRKAIISG
jgi:uncharacterized protein with von Willebrand factor type A (vWA) domain